MSSPLVYLLVGIAFLATLGGVYYKVHHDGYEEGVSEIKSQWQAANAAQREKEAKQSTAAVKSLEVKREKAQVVYKTITKDVEKVVERPIYRNICIDDAGLRDANAAILGKSAAGLKPDNSMPGTQPAH